MCSCDRRGPSHSFTRGRHGSTRYRARASQRREHGACYWASDRTGDRTSDGSGDGSGDG